MSRKPSLYTLIDVMGSEPPVHLAARSLLQLVASLRSLDILHDVCLEKAVRLIRPLYRGQALVLPLETTIVIPGHVEVDVHRTNGGCCR